MPEPILQVTGLVKNYTVGPTTVNALRGVDVSVEQGACMAIVGESGSGKTTLARLVLGIEPPTAGMMVLQGEELPAKRSRSLRRRLQFVQQNPMSTLNPKRTIFQSVSLPLAVHKLVRRRSMRDRVAELLSLVGMSAEYMDRFPSSLSGGQRQRIALARALAAEPDCIVLDEPTSSLDVSVQARVLELLVGLQQSLNLTYIFITHDLSVVRNIAGRMTVLYRGRVVESGDTVAVFERPRHRYTQMLLSSIPVVSSEEEAHKPDWPWDRDIAAGERISEVGCAFHPRCAYALDICRQDRPELSRVEPEHEAACHNPG
jgi:oligopeptide transport system ATP-binding protein